LIDIVGVQKLVATYLDSVVEARKSWSACFWFSYFSELCLYTTLCYQILCRLGLNGTDPLRGTTDMTLFLQAARYNRVNNIRL
jgi:hypothetical protein